jgi:Spy/CpxP family protein refolding chaperone
MNKKSIASLAVLLGLIGPLATASAQQPGPNPGPGFGQPFGDHREMGHGEEGGGMHGGFHGLPHGLWWKNPMVVQQIGITPEQQKKMDDILQQSRLQLIDLKANVERQEVLLRPLLDANPPDTAQVLAQVDKLAQARADLEKANARMLLGIRTVLTPDQWTKLQARRAEAFHNHMDGGNGFRGRRGPDGQGGPGGEHHPPASAPGNPPPPPPAE